MRIRCATIMLLLCIFTIGSALAEGEIYTCPMHPHIISEIEGTCPICAMDLVLLEGGKESSEAQSEGRVTVHIAAQTIQNMGVRTQKAVMSHFGTDVRSYGIVTSNERLQKKIYSRVDGWISELGVSAVGDALGKGAHTYTIHSPDLVLAQHDLLSLERSGRNTDLSKLFVHYKVDKAFVKELRETKKIKEHVPYYSPYPGTVSELYVRPGSYVTLNMPMMVIEDYSSVWINVSVAEKDLQFITKNSQAIVTFPNLGGFQRVGDVDYVYPTIDAASRTGQVRVVLDNKEGKLKPGAYADVEFETRVETRLSVPSEAILKSSEGDFIVIAKGEGEFQPKKVKVGINNKAVTEVISGINAGDDVVVSSQFMIDSESSLREAFRKMKPPKNVSENADKAMTGGGHAGH